jgi:hypothetical protein
VSGGKKKRGAGGSGGGGAQGASRAALMALAQGGNSKGTGMRGAGNGTGGIASEADVPAGFVPERTRAMLTAGQHLLRLQTEPRAPDAQAPTIERTDALQALQQGAAEALLRESVPPAYHDSVRRYFDDLGNGRK